MNAAYWKCNGHQVFINQFIENFRIIKQQNVLVCNSQTAYAIIFVNGITDQSIEDAGNLAKQIVRDKIKELTHKPTK